MKTTTPPAAAPLKVKGPATQPRTRLPRPPKPLTPEKIAARDAKQLARVPASDPKPEPRLCPRCAQPILNETGILCTGCWFLCPYGLRSAWTRAVRRTQEGHPAVMAILNWARPDDPPKEPSVPCVQCKAPMAKPTRRLLASQLRSILPEGTPKKVRECAEFVSRRLDGLCEKCALRMAKELK